jgi:hypothetical protein
MPLEVSRLRDSSLAANASGEEFRAAVLLWCASWHQVPAASLPNDDKQLAQLAGFGRGVKDFQKVHDGAMHGWVLCTDGRWYHPVIAERAVKGWEDRLAFRDKQEKRKEAARIAAEARWNTEKEAKAQASQSDADAERMRNASEEDAVGMRDASFFDAERERESVRERERERDIKSKSKKPSDPPSETPSQTGNAQQPFSTAARKSRATVAPSSEAWEAYAAAYRRRYGADPVRNATVNGQLANFVKRIGQDEAPQVAAFYLDHAGRMYVQAMHPLSFLVRDAEKLRTEWVTGNIQTETRARNTDRLAEQGAVWNRLIQANESQGGH